MPLGQIPVRQLSYALIWPLYLRDSSFPESSLLIFPVFLTSLNFILLYARKAITIIFFFFSSNIYEITKKSLPFFTSYGKKRSLIHKWVLHVPGKRWVWRHFSWPMQVRCAHTSVTARAATRKRGGVESAFSVFCALWLEGELVHGYIKLSNTSRR